MMQARKWERHLDPNNKFSKFEYYLGTRDIEVPKDALVSITYLENLSIFRGMLNGIVSLFVMRHMKTVPGLLYAETRVTGVGCGYTLSVWESKAMVPFRDQGSHARAMRYWSWIFFGGKCQAYFLSFLGRGRIPIYEEAPVLARKHGKHYDGGKLTSPATRPAW